MSPNRTRSLVLALGALVASVSACGVGASDSSRSATTAAAGRAAPATYVVAITVDGLNPSAITRLGRAGAPGFYRMIDNGAATLNARTAYERTETMPDHSSVFTGRRVLTTHAHRVTFNTDDAHTDIHTVAGEYVSSMFDVVHDRGRRTQFYAGKDKFAFWDRSWGSAHGAPDQVGTDDGRDKISHYEYAPTGELVTHLVAALHRAPAALTYLHIPLPDKAGHADGFMSPSYVKAVGTSSRLVGRILDAVLSDPRLRGRTTVVLTADHGGGGLARNHSDPTLLRNYKIPFLVWGAGVTRGANLYTLDPVRVSPGTGRPDYAARPPVRNLDLASLVTTLLGYPAVPGALPVAPLVVRGPAS